MYHSVDHRLIIDKMYNEMVDDINSGVYRKYTERKTHAKSRTVYGWNKHVKDAYKQARLDYQNYVLYGKPECGPIL